jgi:hypothetical protein
LVQENVKGKNVKGEKEDGMNDFPLFGTLWKGKGKKEYSGTHPKILSPQIWTER